ncbi:MAG TPA: hypothetical protein VGF99_10435 [Myxococcota bacterium]
MKNLVMVVMTMMTLTACGGGGYDTSICEGGDTRCTGDIVELCNVDVDNPYAQRYIWTEFEDCSENVDSGRTTCGTFDGTAICEAPEAN